MPAAAAIAVVGSAAIGASAQAKAAKKSANAITQASDQATALQGQIYQDQRNLTTPSITAGATARAHQMLMAGYTLQQVKAYLMSTSAAVNSPIPGIDGSSTTAPTGPRNVMGVNNPFYEGDTGTTDTQTIDAVPGEDYSWVDSWNPSEALTSQPGYQFQFDTGQKALERSKAASGDFFSGDTATALHRYGQDFASNYWDKMWGQYGDLAGDGKDATGTVVNVAGNYGNNAAENITRAGKARASGYQDAGNAWGSFWKDAVPGAIGTGYGYGTKQGWW